MKIEKIGDMVLGAAGTSSVSLTGGHVNSIMLLVNNLTDIIFNIRVRGRKSVQIANNIGVEQLQAISDFFSGGAASMQYFADLVTEGASNASTIRSAFAGLGTDSGEKQYYSLLLPVGSLYLDGGEELLIDITTTAARTVKAYAVESDVITPANVLSYEKYIDSTGTINDCYALFGFIADSDNIEAVDVSLKINDENIFVDFVGCVHYAAAVGRMEGFLNPKMALFHLSDNYIDNVTYKLSGTSAATVSVVSVSRWSDAVAVKNAKARQKQYVDTKLRVLSKSLPALAQTVA